MQTATPIQDAARLSVSERRRIHAVYSGEARVRKASLYTWEQAEVRFQRYRVADLLAKRLLQAGINDLQSLSVLDVGCGRGRFLRMLQEWGVPVEKLHGIDLLESRIAEAQRLSPHINFQVANGLQIPVAEASVQLCTAWTVFSSVVEPQARWNLAQEMLRVTKAGGHIMVYDFAVSDPRNRDTVGISKREIHRLFPGMSCKTTWTTLAPPISRRIGRISSRLTAAVEWCLPFLNTHRIHWIKKS